MEASSYELPLQLRMEYLVDQNKFRLLEPLVTPEVTVPAGFITDGASVPRVFQNLVPAFHRYFMACIVHDYMCVHRKVYPIKEIQRVLKINLERSKISQRYRFAIYYATKFFGPGTVFETIADWFSKK